MKKNVVKNGIKWQFDTNLTLLFGLDINKTSLKPNLWRGAVANAKWLPSLWYLAQRLLTSEHQQVGPFGGWANPRQLPHSRLAYSHHLKWE